MSPKAKKQVSTLLIALLILVMLYSFGVFKKPCLDEECFNKALQSCSSAEFITQKNNNLYVYSIMPSLGKKCSVEITLERIAPGSEPEVVHLLEGKSMQCKIPKTITKRDNVD